MTKQLANTETQINENLLSYSLGDRIDVEDYKLVVVDNNIKNNYRLRKIDKIVFNKDEDSISKLNTVLSTINSLGSDMIMIYHNKNTVLTLYIGVKNNNLEELSTSEKTLVNVINSNFNGCSISGKIRNGTDEIKEIHSTIQNPHSSIVMTTAIPSQKDKEENKENFIQGMEKFLLAMQDKDYTAIFLAENISDMVDIRKNGYEELHTSLFPFISKDVSIGLNSSDSEGTSLSNTINTSITKTTSNTKTTSTNTPSYLQKIQMAGVPFLGAAALIFKKITNKKIDLENEKNPESFDSLNKTDSSTSTKSEMSGKNTTNGMNRNHTIGNSIQTTIKNEDKFFKNKIDNLDMQLTRIKQSQNYGMYDFAAYFISNDKAISNTAASIYNSLIRGDESFLGHSYTKSFSFDDSKEISKYLINFEHPKFKIDQEEISITSMISSKELAIAMNLPKKSLPGLFVKESVEFGKEILKKPKGDTISIGNIYNLGKTTKYDIPLAVNDFSMHTLITGATGSGKSTTTYKFIDELRQKNINFLVIEPTKGEYKHIFGNEKDVSVYGTNENITPLLKINPFSFPAQEIHILEHIDRLVEIFNACWPMYAAMPAVLKDAILNAYEDKDWDLEESYNDNMQVFPTFDDVLESLDNIMENSSYSNDTKSDYKGALATRLNSLTKGLIGKIFTEDDLDDKQLFDENVIVDISRVGSSETKSLIMGILLLKLNQYRLAKGKMNAELKHITVLEEAHHLLPRVSKENSAESGNIKGKAVEMLSNAIAEMRTYGEGFIIVDQSPNMLDIAAIRNTNTKIIMRLSEMDDRNDIGKSATLSEEQINEIPKLEQGVAIVYQNGWEESILGKIQMSDLEKQPTGNLYYHKKQNNNIIKLSTNENKCILTNIVKILTLFKTNILKEERESIEQDFAKNKNKYNIWADSNLKQEILKYISNSNLTINQNARYLTKLLNGRKILNKINKNPIDKYKILNNILNIQHQELEIILLEILNVINSDTLERLQEFESKIELGRL